MNQAMRLLCKLCLLAAFFVLAPPEVLAQTIAKGQVVDSNNEPVIGATVVEKGTPKNATVTDFDGNFTLKLQKAKQVVISYIGMVSQEVTASENMQVILKDDAASLEEVVVVGYTSRARKDLTGSVGSVSGTKLAVVPVSSAAEALQGKIAGVQITTVDGQPGADINVRIRGNTSVTSENRPLFIVDGFEADNINDIPPSDIASIDVLKDASLTAIYGARGGNGVVVVTTKSAQAGKVQVGFNGRLSISHLAKKLDLMNTEEFVRYQWDRAAAGSTRSNAARYFRGNFGNRDDMDLYKYASSHDWQEEVMGETPINYSANVTIGGGNEKVRFNLSLTQSDDRGIILGTGVRRTNLNGKFVVNITDNLTFNYNPKFTYRRDIGAGGEGVGSGGIIDVLRYRPTNGLREFAFWDPATVDPDDEAIFAYTNPKSDIGQNQREKHQYTYVNQFSLNWRPITGLMLKTDFSHSMSFRDDNQFWGFMTSTGKGSDGNRMGIAAITDRKTQSWTWTNTASYDMTVKENHNLSFLLGAEFHDSQYKQNYMKNRYFSRDVDADAAWANMTLGTPWQATSELSTSDRMASFFGQASYNYDHRYLVSVTMRADGSTYFAPGHQWGYFPSLSAGWVISEEPFMKDIKWITQLKLRAAIGLSGNNRIKADQWRYLYSISANGGPGFAESATLGEKYYAISSTLANENIKWETTLTRNIAADISLFDGRLTITPEIYWNKTRDLLYESPLATNLGYTSQVQNIGEVSNKGYELTLSGDLIRGKDYVLTANLTFGHNKMVVEKLNNTDNILWNQNSRWKSSYNDYCLRVGDEVGLIYGFVYDGLYSPDEFTFDPNQNFLAIPKEGTVINTIFDDSNSGEATLPGKIKFKDLNGDGQITASDDPNISDDRTVIGNTNPKYQGGFGLSGQYKDWDFTANFTYMLDFDINNATAYALSSVSGAKGQTSFTNVLSKFTNCWRYTREGDYENVYKNYYDDGATDEYIAMNAGKTLWNPSDVTNNVTHSYFIEDGSFLRCSDVTIGYTFPTKLSKKWGMSKLRAYVSASNLFIITGYSGYDPEVDIQTGLTPGMDYNRYPRNRSFVFGVNLNF
jgi:TonB-linked SusC/RagA family outer membrane protein